VQAVGGDPGGRESSAGIQSVDRAVTVLEILARTGGVGVSDVAVELGVHKSTASRLLSALEERELVQQDGDRGKYRLGFGVLRLANAVVGRLDLVSQGHSVLDELAGSVGETVNIAVLRSHFAVNVDQAHGGAAVAAQNWTGQVTPLHVTSSGKVLLAHQSAPSRRRLLDAAHTERFTDRTITSRRTLLGQLDEIVRSGFGITIEEYEEGLNAVAAPVRDHTGEVIAAISVSGPAYRLHRTRIDDVLPELLQAAAEVSTRMGQLG
jgi:DNA-binding IclR family transcriptional regulator